MISQVHHDLPELTELVPGQWLSEYVRDHFIGPAIQIRNKASVHPLLCLGDRTTDVLTAFTARRIIQYWSRQSGGG